MRQKIIPILITTWTALRRSLKAKYLLVHIDNILYQRRPARIIKKMAKNGYSPIQQQAKTGVFFYRNADGFVFDPDIHEIHDPAKRL